ncbi:MAG: hypothetical protein V1806_13195 [Pseudomonadota bacterium]
MFKAPLALALAVALALALGAGPARADEITDQIERSIKLYKEGNVSEALNELEFASGLLRQKKAESLTAIFPEPPSGWKAEKPETQAMGKAFFGGGISATRTYKQEKGKGKVTIEVMSDSPLLQGVAMMLTNPMMVQSAQGSKLIRIGDEKAILQTHGSEGAEVQMVVDNKILVKTEARGLADPGETAKDFVSKVDLKKLRQLNK